MVTAKRELPAAWITSGQLKLLEDQYVALQDVDALALVTEWKPFRHPDFARMQQAMKNAVIFDGRNQYEPRHMRDLGFEYHGIGRDDQQ